MKSFANVCLLALCVLALVGCASASFDQFNSDLSAMRGRTEQDLFAALGMPDGKMDMNDGSTIYVWGRQQTSTYMTTVPQTSTAFINGQMVTMTTNTPQMNTANYQCTVKVSVNNGTVMGYDYDGNLGGCQPYIDRLNSYIKQHGGSQVEQSNKRQAYAKCVEIYSFKFANKNLPFEETTSQLEAYCKEKTSSFYPNIASYYAKKAMDVRKSMDNAKQVSTGI